MIFLAAVPLFAAPVGSGGAVDKGEGKAAGMSASIVSSASIGRRCRSGKRNCRLFILSAWSLPKQINDCHGFVSKPA
ncbi:hypothetical protein RPHASCH2410_CH00720 [Rhizobium phaseoli Ch24-10]|nr:hypothetical protein RPHASCH2410_CH00720 [Rhizobium phaseoli Ch24-10]